MPVNKNGVGHSKATKNKRECFEKIVSQILSVIRVIQNKHNYVNKEVFYIDTNAGPGYNLEENCDGSPITFIKTAKRLKLKYQAHFIEIDEDNASNLEVAIRDYDDCFVHTGNNKDILPELLPLIAKNTYGILYMDANGIPDFDLLKRASIVPNAKTIDFIIRFPATAIKRNYTEDIGALIKLIKSINKRHWIVKGIDTPESGWQWSMLVGLNTNKMRAWTSQEFYYIDSEDGRKILEYLSLTKKQLKKKREIDAGQMTLPGFLLTQLTGSTSLILSFERLDRWLLKGLVVSVRNVINDLLQKFII